MKEQEPQNGKATPQITDPERLHKVFKEFRQVIKMDAETGRYAPPPVLQIDWSDAFPHLPR